VDSSYAARTTMGTQTMHFAPENVHVAEAVSLSLDLAKKAARVGLGDEEIEFASNWLVQRYPFRMQTPARRLAAKIGAVLTGRPEDDPERFVERVRAVNPAQVREALARHWNPGRVAVVVVGDPSLADSLSKLPGLRRLRTVNADHVGPLPSV